MFLDQQLCLVYDVLSQASCGSEFDPGLESEFRLAIWMCHVDVHPRLFPGEEKEPERAVAKHRRRHVNPDTKSLAEIVHGKSGEAAVAEPRSTALEADTKTGGVVYGPVEGLWKSCRSAAISSGGIAAMAVASRMISTRAGGAGGGAATASDSASSVAATWLFPDGFCDNSNPTPSAFAFCRFRHRAADNCL